MNAQTLQQLKMMSREQLVDTAKQQGLKVHGKAKPETIINQIMANMVPPTQTDKAEPKAKPAPVVDHNTEEDVLKAVQKLVDRGLEVKFPGDGTWHFKCRGAEDSGNLSIPLRVIVMKAGTVAQGARRIRTQSDRDFDAIPTNPQSRYTSTVLA